MLKILDIYIRLVFLEKQLNYAAIMYNNIGEKIFKNIHEMLYSFFIKYL